jgi:sugar O-acyltransferase (sialic acid O-acetyltransferase NeuD family)
MKKIILVGAGGHAASCIDVIKQEKKFKIIGLVDNKKEIGDYFLNFKILGKDKNLQKLRKIAKYAFVTVGQVGLSQIRKKLFLKLIKLGFILPNIISPISYVSKDTTFKRGSIVHHGAIVNSQAEIGNNCIINSKSLIEHGVKLGSHTHVATSAVINGNTQIGEECFIGSSAVIRNNIKIKKRTFIKMGEKIYK